LAAPAAAKPTFRRARLWVALLIAAGLGAAVAAFTNLTTQGRALELRVSDSFRSLASLPDDPAPVTVIAIDDAAIQTFGHWPWPWTSLADVIDILNEMGARLVVLDIEFPEEDTPRAVDDVGPDGKAVERVVHTVPRFVESVRKAGNVVIPFSLYVEVATGEAPAGTETDAPSEERVQSVAPESCVAVRQVLLPHAVKVSADSLDRLWTAESFLPMIPPLTGACAGSGYTTFRHDPEDSVVRRVPLLIRGSGTVFPEQQVFPHMMLEAAAMWQFGRGYSVELRENRLVIVSADSKTAIGIPVDERAQLELRWPKSLASLDQLNVLPLVLSGSESRRRYRAIMCKLDQVWPDEGWVAAARLLEQTAARASATPGDAAAAKELPDLRQRLAAAEEHLTMNLLAAIAETRDRPPGDEQSRRACAVAGKEIPFIEGYVKEAQAERPVQERFRPYVRDRLCIIGRYATGVSDFHATPIGSNQPGVTVYPAGIRTILSGLAFRHLPSGAEWLMTVLTAALVALTVHMQTGRGVAAAVLLSALVIAAAAASASAAMLLPVAGPVLAIVVAFAGVSGYRQLTEAAGSRWITRVFEQYGSPELLEELKHDPDKLRLGGERLEITALFSDIAGFTPLSEKLGPEQLVAMLKRYLSAMTDVILAERAALDKYEGDAIIALFGALVRMPDHPLRAVRAALTMHETLPRINDELIKIRLLPEGAGLTVRIGLATGPAIVGNFGSEQRFNYTAMGDTMNLASRLEEANRWLGSRILVPEVTAAACGDKVLFRKFGPARIRGKAQPVIVYEPLAMEPAPADLRALAEAYGRAVDALASRDIAAAESALKDVLAARPDDAPAKALRDRIEAARAGRQPPDEPWNLTKSK
jgi:class 3 adenylate cyclase